MLSNKACSLFAIFAVLTMLTATMSAKTRVARQAVGKTSEGTPVDLYSLQDGKIEVRMMTYGGIVVSLGTPDRKGKLDDVGLGRHSRQEHEPQTGHFGGSVGLSSDHLA